MTLGEALQAYDVAVRAEIIRKMAEMPPSSLEDAAAQIDAGLVEGRKQALPIIRAVGGEDAVTAWDEASSDLSARDMS
jgi:ABC-type methionine transport system ATPase subunit